MNKRPCQACRTPVADMSRRFDTVLGFCCTTCFEFLHHAAGTLREVGIEGSATDPVRFTPTISPETP